MGHAQAAAENFSDEHRMLRDSAQAFAARDASLARLKSLKQRDVDFDRDAWSAMVELGWSAILVPGECDGLGLDLAAAAIIAQELGKVVAPEPFVECGGIAVSLLGALPAGTIRNNLLREIAGGEKIAIVCATPYVNDDLAALPSAERQGDDYHISGEIDCVPIARSADGFLVPCQWAGELAVFWVDSSTPGLEICSRSLADNTTHAAVLFKDVCLARDMMLARGANSAPALSAALDTGHVLAAAYLSGIASQSLQITLEYLRMRKQFGASIGSFQALQHRTVDLFIHSELANAVVSAALTGMATISDTKQRAILAARAKYRATDTALKVTREAIQLHGAIGFTYECDIGHFLNRAMVIGSRDGNASTQLRRLGHLLNGVPSVDDENEQQAVPKAAHEVPRAQLNELDDEDFRAIVRQWFQANYPETMRYPPRRFHWHEIKPWYLTVSEQGWLAPSWPVAYGGMGLSPAKVLIYIEEQERWGIGRAPDMGITMIGPLLIKYGNDAQRDYYLPKILAGEHVWCQGYSEPNSGSDLASLQTEAVLDGDEFVVNGQKTWTTLAQDATHIFLLVRTDKSVKQQSGISFLLVDIESPGISIRPIKNLAGDEEFCEVFFDNVRVPAENLVGELNTGWSIAKALLSFERIFLGSPKQSQYALQRLEGLAEGRALFEDTSFLDRFTRLKLDTIDLESIYTRFAEIVRQGGTLGPDVSLLKIWATETFARLSELMLEAAAEYGAESGDLEFGEAKANVLSQFYNARPATIYGGSNEIQRNIIAKHVLALPQS